MPASMALLLLAALPFEAPAITFGWPRWVVYEAEERAEPCSDVRRLDVRNMEFAPRHPESPIRFRLKGGVATHGPDTPSDWRTNLFLDRTVSLEGGRSPRFVGIFDSYVGPNSRTYLFVLDCAGGKASPSRMRVQTFAWTPSHGKFARVADEERAIPRRD